MPNKKKPAPKTDDQLIDDRAAEAPTIEQLQEFHVRVMEYHAELQAVDKRIETCQSQLKGLKDDRKKTEIALAAYLNDDELPLLNGADE